MSLLLVLSIFVLQQYDGQCIVDINAGIYFSINYLTLQIAPGISAHTVLKYEVGGLIAWPHLLKSVKN